MEIKFEETVKPSSKDVVVKATFRNNWSDVLRTIIAVVAFLGTIGVAIGIGALALPADLAVQDYWLGLAVAGVGLLGIALIYLSHHILGHWGVKGVRPTFFATIIIIVVFGGVDLVLVNVPHYAFKAWWPMLNGVWSGIILVVAAVIWVLLMRGASRFKKI